MIRSSQSGSHRAPATVSEAIWPRDLAIARTLLRHYQAHLLLDHAGAGVIHLDGFEDELAHLQTRWGPPRAAILLASVGGVPAGCAAVHLLQDRPGSAELKRMWVEPETRGHGAGRALGVAATAWAGAHGAGELLLDTVPAVMPEANRLYVSLGFERCARYNSNAVADVVFFRRSLA